MATLLLLLVVWLEQWGFGISTACVLLPAAALQVRDGRPDAAAGVGMLPLHGSNFGDVVMCVVIAAAAVCVSQDAWGGIASLSISLGEG